MRKLLKMDFLKEEDIETIKKLRRNPNFDAKSILNKKRLSGFELDLVMNGD